MSTPNEGLANTVADAATEVVAKLGDTSSNQPTPEPSKKKDEEPSLSAEGEFFVRRIVEGVSKALREAAEADDEEDDTDEDSPKRRRRRKTVPEVPQKKRSFLGQLFTSPFVGGGK